MVKILVTGAAGFIGFHLSQRLLTRGDEVVGLDNLNNYYDVTLKKDRLTQLLGQPSFSFHKLDLQTVRAWLSSLQNNASMWWSTWQLRLAYATRYKTLMLT